MANDTGPIRLGYPAYRVFIYGLEVTADVTSVNIGYHDGDMPNQCSIQLLNEFDKYVITTNDMISIAGISRTDLHPPWLDQDSNPDTTNENFVDSKISDPGIFSAEKREILMRKDIISQNVPLEDRLDPFGRPMDPGSLQADYFGPTINKYPITDGAPVFHAMDPVRVFYRDPFDPKRWYHMFCGFVSDMVDSVTENNAKTLTIVVEDPTKLFRYTRVFLNPGVLDAAKVIGEGDLKIQSFWTQAMYDYTLPEVFFTLLFGTDFGKARIRQNADSITSETPTSTKMRGIGHFAADMSAICTVGPPPPAGSTEANKEIDAEFHGQITVGDGIRAVPVIHLGENLQTWQLLIDHEVQPTDMYTMATETDRFSVSVMDYRKDVVQDIEGSLGEIQIDKVVTYIGSRPDEYPVDGGRLMMLIPRALGAENNSILMKDLITSYPLTSDSESVGSIMYQTLSRIEFVMYCSPRGDLVVEPPLYDFDPDDFGLEELQEEQVKTLFERGTNEANDGGVTSLAYDYEQLNTALTKFPGGGPRGPFGKNYIILKRDTYNWENAHVDDRVYTVAVAKRAYFKNWDRLPFSDLLGELEVVRRQELIPLYGYRQAPVTPRGYIYTPDGAHLYAEICLNRLNAEAHTMRISHVPNIKLWLNRPIYVQGRNMIATTKNIDHGITWGAAGDMHTNCSLFSGRTWNGQMSATDPTRPIYTTLGGYGKQLNYAMLFNIAPKPSTIPSATSVATTISDSADDIATRAIAQKLSNSNKR